MMSVGGKEAHSGEGGDLHHEETDETRRATLAKIGRFAYAAPVFALLAEPKAVKAYGGKNKPPKNKPRKK